MTTETQSNTKTPTFPASTSITEVCPRTGSPSGGSRLLTERLLAIVPRHAEVTSPVIDGIGAASITDQGIRRGAGYEGRAARRSAGRRLRAASRDSSAHGEYQLDREAGMATAEYAIATLAAVGFAALLVAVLSSGQIKGLLTSLITTALNFG